MARSLRATPRLGKVVVMPESPRIVKMADRNRPSPQHWQLANYDSIHLFNRWHDHARLALTLDQMRILVRHRRDRKFLRRRPPAGGARCSPRSARSIRRRLEDRGLAWRCFDRSGKTRANTTRRGGAAILADARRLLDGAQCDAASERRIAAEIEPELAFAVDAADSQRSADGEPEGPTGAVPMMPVSIFT